MAREIAVPLDLEQVELARRPAWVRLWTLARRHPLGVFGLLCVALLFF